MEDAVVFIGLVIIGVTQAIKLLVPNVNGAVTIGVSVLVGLLVALLDEELGLNDITPALGIMTGLAAPGVITVARNVSGKS